MCVTLIGGMDRLKADYEAAAREKGHQLRHVSRNEANFKSKTGEPDLLIIFTNKVSHEAKRKALSLAKARNIPIKLVHSCGLSTLRECLP